MFRLIRYFKKRYDDYVIPRRFLKLLIQHVQECYRLGYTTDEIENGFRQSLDEYLKPETKNCEEHQQLLRNLRRLITANHPINPTNFEAIP